MSKINVRESLRNIDADSCCKYDLLTMYDACPLTDEDKADIAKLLFDNEDPEVIYQKLCTYFCDDDVSELTGLADVQNVTPFEAIIDNVKMGLGKKCDQVFYNDVAGQFEFKIGDTTYTFGLSPVEYDADGISVYVDYNYDMPINYTSIKEAAEDILDKCDKKVLQTSQSNDDIDDDTMEYTVYDVVEDEGRLCAKCMNESTNSFEDIKLGKVNSDAVNELLNNILNNPNYKLTDECKRKIADNSAPWGIVMSPSFDITASNALMSTGDFGGSVSFGESEQCAFENGDRVTDGERKGTVIDCDAVKVLVDWDYSETDDIEWVMKEDLSFVNALKESENSPEVTYKQDRRLNSTSVIYKGYLIKIDRGGDGYNVYDKYRELEDTGFPSMEAAKKFVDELVTKDKMYESTTNYDWYRNTDSGVNIFMLGYDEADPDYADWETESDTEAEDWFNSYTGFEDDEDEIDESLDESYSVKDVKEFLDEVGGYTDYDGKVEELMHYFGMTKEQAESAIQDCVTSADDEIEESVSSSATAEVISNELKSAAYKLFKTPRWGFETDKEIKDYINPFFDVSEDPKTGDLEVQVRAELDYDNLVDLSNALDKVVSKYDKDAYFEAEQPGIITAVISYS